MKGLVLPLWAIWDWIYYHCNRMKYVSKKENLFRVVRKKYKGPPLLTDDGYLICNGDEIIKVHLYNYRLAKEIRSFASEIAYIIYFKRTFEQSLRGLSQYISELPDHENIKGIIGTSMLNRGAHRFGFTICQVDQTWVYWFKGWLYKIIYLLIHPEGWDYLKKHGDRLESKHLVMSTAMLKSKYSD